MAEYYECHFELTGVKIPPYRELASPPKNDLEISVCATTWNRTKDVIKKSIKTIFDQQFPEENYEVILIDDATRGERAKEVEDAVNELIQEYPNHNFRAYFTNYTRCCTDPHTLNVGFKRALGSILMISQVDIIHVGETLEAAWRHINAINNLWFCPKHYAGDLDNPWPFQFFPHEMGAAILKTHIHRVKGRNERIKKSWTEEGAISDGVADVEFHEWLKRVGIIFGEDPSVKTIHFGEHPGPRMGCPPGDVGMYDRNPDGTWTDGDWGVLTAEEEENTLMTERMKKTLGI